MDANVLIDYVAADGSVLTMISLHVGRIHVPSVLLEEVDDLDKSECERLGLLVMEPSLSLLTAAATRRPGLSYNDHLCLLAAKQEGWICVTNDGRLRRECTADGVDVLWGLEPMITLVVAGQLAAVEAMARRIPAGGGGEDCLERRTDGPAPSVDKGNLSVENPGAHA